MFSVIFSGQIDKISSFWKKTTFFTKVTFSPFSMVFLPRAKKQKRKKCKQTDNNLKIKDSRSHKKMIKIRDIQIVQISEI
jgi:hypothetical protein